MPYLFKLARRVARCRTRVVLTTAALFLAACESSDRTLNGPTLPHPNFSTATGLPAGVTDLAVVAMTDSSATLTFTEVDDGTGAPASYDIRVGPTPLAWGGTVPSVKRGTCATPVDGTTIGVKRSCTVLGLTTATAYDFQLVTYRGTLMVNAVFGQLSNVASGITRTPAPTAPASVTDLKVAGATDTMITLSFTEVTDGTGQPASYDVRYVPGATLTWGGTVPSVSRGTCAMPLTGTGIGATRTCTVTGLAASTQYSFELVAYRGTLNVNAVFGDLSNVATGATTVPAPVAVASVSAAPTSASLAVGGTQQLTATLKDASGNALTGRTVTWTSGNAAVATVNGSGLVTAVAPGSATIKAASGAVEGWSAITVTALTSIATVTAPGTVTDLKVTATTDSTVTLSFTEVNDGTGKPASYDVRSIAGSSMPWGGVPSVSRGTCAAPMAGTTIGAKRTCTVPGLTAATTYSVQLIAFRGTLNVNAVFGGLSNIATGATTGSSLGGGSGGGSGGGGSGGGPGQVTYYRTNFNDGTTGPLDVYGSGSCAASTDYHDPGSAYGMKCTASGTHAAALQAWFGNGRLANLPLDPSLDQDLFEQVRFVLAPGAAAAIGGTSCNSSNPNSQFKVHKSVYGQAGSAWNGWVMAEIAPCTDGNIGLFSEAEMWNINGQEFRWPGTYPDLHEGSVYDVVYRYHRYTSRGCGTFAMWVNGTKVMDTPCASYMGTTNGSGQGLLFWDGLTYVQNSLTPLTVYTLFAQATNYPVGAGTASN